MRAEREARKATVFDVETTGFSNSDRIVEIATITLDTKTGEITNQFSTLINPEQSVGATFVHGISSDMVESAPTFAEVAFTIAQIIDGSILVAHNLPFDVRMLKNEFARVGGKFDPGRGFCTWSATRMKLAAACHHFGIDFNAAHRAAHDAEATALLTFHCAPDWATLIPAQAKCHGSDITARVVNRSSEPKVKMVCFTGAVVFHGERYTRVRLESIAAQHGLLSTSAVSSACDVLVAANLATSSAKARKARQLGIPIISAQDFLSEYAVGR